MADLIKQTYTGTAGASAYGTSGSAGGMLTQSPFGAPNTVLYNSSSGIRLASGSSAFAYYNVALAAVSGTPITIEIVVERKSEAINNDTNSCGISTLNLPSNASPGNANFFFTDFNNGNLRVIQNGGVADSKPAPFTADGEQKTLRLTIPVTGNVTVSVNGTQVSSVADTTINRAQFYAGEYLGGAFTDNQGYAVRSITVTGQPAAPPAIAIGVWQDGDSVSQYAGNLSTYYKADIEAVVKNTTVTVTNVAVAGQSQKQMLSDEVTQIINNNPPLLVCGTSLNDMALVTGGVDGGINGDGGVIVAGGRSASGIAAYKTNLRNYINNALNHTNSNGLATQVVMATDNYCGQELSQPYARPSADQLFTSDTAVSVYAEFADNPNFRFVNLSRDFFDKGIDTPALYALLLSDKVHPNTSGYQLMNARIAPIVAQMAHYIANGVRPGAVSASNITATSVTVAIADATGGASISGYQWHQLAYQGQVTSSTTAIQGATSATYTRTGLSASTPYRFKCVATDTSKGFAVPMESSELTVTTIAPMQALTPEQAAIIAALGLMIEFVNLQPRFTQFALSALLPPFGSGQVRDWTITAEPKTQQYNISTEPQTVTATAETFTGHFLSALEIAAAGLEIAFISGTTTPTEAQISAATFYPMQVVLPGVPTRADAIITVGVGGTVPNLTPGTYQRVVRVMASPSVVRVVSPFTLQG